VYSMAGGVSAGTARAGKLARDEWAPGERAVEEARRCEYEYTHPAPTPRPTSSTAVYTHPAYTAPRKRADEYGPDSPRPLPPLKAEKGAHSPGSASGVRAELDRS
jgi:hypothetical protein